MQFDNWLFIERSWTYFHHYGPYATSVRVRDLGDANWLIDRVAAGIQGVIAGRWLDMAPSFVLLISWTNILRAYNNASFRYTTNDIAESRQHDPEIPLLLTDPFLLRRTNAKYKRGRWWLSFRGQYAWRVWLLGMDLLLKCKANIDLGDTPGVHLAQGRIWRAFWAFPGRPWRWTQDSVRHKTDGKREKKKWVWKGKNV